MPTRSLTLVPIGSARELTRMEPEGPFVEAAGLRTRIPL